MTMLFFFFGDCSGIGGGGVLTTGVVIRRRAASGEAARGRKGASVPPQERAARGVLVFFGDCSGVGMCVDHGRGCERIPGGKNITVKNIIVIPDIISR